MTRPRWYALQTLPRKEAQVDAYLGTQGYETYYPTLRVTPVNPRAAKVQPFFPGYLFVRVDLAEVGINALRWLPGAVGVVRFDEQPAALADSIIERLRQHTDQQLGQPAAPAENWQKGDEVLVHTGPLRGCEGIFDTRLNGGERVQILLQLLGRSVRAAVNVNAIGRKPLGSRR